MSQDNEQSTDDLVTYEIDYGDTAMEGGAEYTLERYQAIAGGNVASIIEGYAEANGYEIREIEGKGASNAGCNEDAETGVEVAEAREGYIHD